MVRVAEKKVLPKIYSLQELLVPARIVNVILKGHIQYYWLL
jgi:hypothetical protein